MSRATFAMAEHHLHAQPAVVNNRSTGGEVEADDKTDYLVHAMIIPDAQAKGPGEHDATYFLPAGTGKMNDKLYKVNGFNELASDFIALNRSLPDIRNPG
ncbi:polypeptide N-acetylgalactosaminyltransferase 13-like [Dermacentor albipictus]|uniref:polypeptide N-acetylgalactosaminyltransferase 13-like n=1 Tax=Dermacentor albipictus TaxID=60249 RepID=UPI0038FD230C